MKASCPYPPSCREHPFPETGPPEPTDRTEVDSEAPALLAKMQKTRRRVLEIPTRHRVSISQPGARSQMCRPCRSPPEETLKLILLLSYLRRRTAYPSTPPPISRATAGRTNEPGATPPLGGRSFSTVASILTVCSWAMAVGTRISMATKATTAR